MNPLITVDAFMGSIHRGFTDTSILDGELMNDGDYAVIKGFETILEESSHS